MPEGPSQVIVKEQLIPIMKGNMVIAASGNAKIDMKSLVGKKVTQVKTWGKHLLLVFPSSTVSIHFLLFGKWSVNEKIRAAKSIRLKLTFKKDEVYFYTCAVRLLDGPPGRHFDWEGDVMNPKWNAAKAKSKVKEQPRSLICDVLLDQDIFAGVGNIIKNEVLFRARLHPETLVKNIPPRVLSKLIKEARDYSFDFLEWKKEGVLTRNWQVHKKNECPRCKIKLQKKYPGKTKRRTFFCSNCQLKYKAAS